MYLKKSFSLKEQFETLKNYRIIVENVFSCNFLINSFKIDSLIRDHNSKIISFI